MSQIRRPISSLKPLPENVPHDSIVIVEDQFEKIESCPPNQTKVSIMANTCIDQPVTEPLVTENTDLKPVSVTNNTLIVEKPKSQRWSQVAAFILWLFILTILFWLIYYSLRPRFVLKPDDTEPDLSKVLLFAFLTALVILIFVWLIKLCVS